MKLQININEDDELRNYIKELVERQIVSVTRDEVRALVKETIANKMDEYFKVGNFRELVDRYIRVNIGNILADKGVISSWNTSFAQPAIESAVNKIMAENKAGIETRIESVVANVFSREISEIVKDKLKN